MATISQGAAVSFNGHTFTEVYDLKYDYGGGVPTARQYLWKSEMGTVSFSSFGFISSSNWGVRAIVSISSGGLNFTNMAVCTSVSGTAEVNGVTKYSASFKLLAY